MSYTIGFKEKWIKRALNRGNKSFISVAREAGIPEQTLRYWIKSAAEGTLRKESKNKANNPTSQSNRQKFKLIIESRNILKKMLTRKFQSSENLLEQIDSYTDTEKLDRALEEILTAETAEKVLELLK